MNVPLRTSQTDNTSPPVYFREIMFSPSGSVISQGTSGNDKILLWVRNGSQANPTVGEPVLIGIQMGTGFIGGYPVDITGGDPYNDKVAYVRFASVYLDFKDVKEFMNELKDLVKATV